MQKLYKLHILVIIQFKEIFLTPWKPAYRLILIQRLSSELLSIDIKTHLAH